MSSQSVHPTFPKLNEHNYHTWKYDIQAQLQQNGTWRVVSGVIPSPHHLLQVLLLVLMTSGMG